MGQYSEFVGVLSVLPGLQAGVPRPPTVLLPVRAWDCAEEEERIMVKRELKLVSCRLWACACFILLVLATGSPVKAQLFGAPNYPLSYPTGGPVNAIAVGDVNGDGHLDIVTGNSNSTISVILGKGDGTFLPAVTYPAPQFPYLEYVLLGDFNNDGHLDIVVASPSAASPGLGIFFGNGDGTFRPMVAITVNDPNTGNTPICNSYPYSGLNGLIAAGDFNKDSNLDLVTCNPAGQGVAIWLGNGDGTFQSPAFYSVGATVASIAVGDLNGDGSLDLVTANLGTPPSFPNAFSVLLGIGDGTFQPAVIYGAQGDFAPYGVMLGDFNGDGILDIAGLGGHLDILLGDGKGAFQLAPGYSNYYASQNYNDLIAIAGALGDFNDDGHLDVAFITGSGGHFPYMMLGNGDGSFQPLTSAFFASNPFNIVSGDFNGDGSPDLAVSSGASVVVALNNSTGSGGTGGGGGGTGGGGSTCLTFIDNGAGIIGQIQGCQIPGESCQLEPSIPPSSNNPIAYWYWSCQPAGSTTTTGATNNGSSGGTFNSCNCTLKGNYVPPVKPVTVGKTVAPITDIKPDPDQFTVFGQVDVTTSAPDGIASAQQAKNTKAGIATGDPTVTIKGFKGFNAPTTLAYNGQYQVVKVVDATHYTAQNVDPTAQELVLSPGVVPEVQPTSGVTSTAAKDPLQSSQNNNPKYTLSATIATDANGNQLNYYSSIKITLTATGADVTPHSLNSNHIWITTHWDFSPDEDRFYVDWTDPTSASLCTEFLEVFDLTTGSLIVSSGANGATVAASSAQFSPSGKYLVYMANEYSSGCPTAAVPVPFPNNVHLSIWKLWGVAKDSANNPPLYSVPYLFTSGLPSQVTQDLSFGGVGTWGFSPDYAETSFVYAYANTASTLQWTVVNLAASSAGHTVVASNSAVPITVTTGTTNLAAFWQFSPCANVAALITPGQAANQSNVTLYDLSTGEQMKSSTFSVNPSSLTLVTDAVGQEAKIGSSTFPLLTASCGKANTPAGQNVEVHPIDSGTSTAPVDMIFSNVTTSGTTSVTSSTTAPSPATPQNFMLGTPPTYYDISTGASYTASTPPASPAITICINYAGFKYGNPSAIRLYHYDTTLTPPAWVDITLSNDPATATACGTVNSLSPFALFEPTSSTPTLATSLISSANPSAFGQTVTFTDTLTASGGSAPSGSVTFLDGATPLGSAVALVNGGPATLAIGTLSAGTHTITAQYSGDSTYSASTSNAISQTVNNSSSTTTTISTTNGTYGTATSATVSVSSAGGTVAGNVTLTLDGGTASTLALSNGSAVFNLGVLNAGSHSLAANFAAQGSFLASSATGTLSVAIAPLTIAPGNVSVQYGQAIPSSFSVTYSGFVNGDTTASLSGVLSCTTTATPASAVGVYPINCTGLTSSNYAITYGPGALTVTPAPLTVAANNATRPYGANNPAFTGSVVGLLNSDPIIASLSSSAIPASPVGAYVIAAALVGAPNVLSNYAVTLVNGTLTVSPEATILTVAPSPTSIPVGQSTVITVTLTAPDMVIPIDPNVLAPVTVSSPIVSDILTNNGACTLVPGAAPGTAACSITLTAVEPNGRTLMANFAGSSALLASNNTADLVVTAPLETKVSCINSNFRNVAVPGDSYLWFNSVFRVHDVAKQKITITFFQSSVQFQYTDAIGNLVKVNQPMPDAKIVIDPSMTSASTTFDPVNNVWITTIPFDLDDNAFLTGLPWPVPSAGLPADIEPVTWCGTFASDTAGVDIGWRWSAAAYSSFSNDSTVLGVKPMNTDHDNPPANRDNAGTPENFKTSLIPGARGRGGKNYTGSYSGSAEIE
jgi:hypothetical protein